MMKSDDFQSYEEVSTAFANPDMPYVVVGEEAYVVEGGRLPASITLRVALIPKQYDHFPQKITLKEGEETYVYNNTIHTRYAHQGENAHFVQNIACQWMGEGVKLYRGLVCHYMRDYSKFPRVMSCMISRSHCGPRTFTKHGYLMRKIKRGVCFPIKLQTAMCISPSAACM